MFKNIKKRLLINIDYIKSNSKNYISVVFSLIGVIGTFISIPELITPDKAIAFLVVSVAACFLVSVLNAFFSNTNHVFTTGTGKNIYIKYGDIFSKKITRKAKKRIIVVPVNRCFDVIVNDELISANTIHGQCIKKLIPKYHSEESLNDLIQQELDNQNLNFEMLTQQNKSQGNLKRYPEGTVVKICCEDIFYYFLALSKFDERLHASTSDQEYIIAIHRLLQYYNTYSQGYPMILPLIGSGASDIRKEQNDILDYMISVLKMEKQLINSDIYIVIKEDQKYNMSIKNIC